MSRTIEDLNRRLLRVRDGMDRTYAQALDVPALASIANLSEAHFIRHHRERGRASLLPSRPLPEDL